jgi:hypothetical protein
MLSSQKLKRLRPDDAFVKSLAGEGELGEDRGHSSVPGEWRWASGRKSEITAIKLAST